MLDSLGHFIKVTSLTVKALAGCAGDLTASWFGIVVLDTTLSVAQTLGMTIRLVTVTHLSVRQH